MYVQKNGIVENYPSSYRLSEININMHLQDFLLKYGYSLDCLRIIQDEKMRNRAALICRLIIERIGTSSSVSDLYKSPENILPVVQTLISKVYEGINKEKLVWSFWPDNISKFLYDHQAVRHNLDLMNIDDLGCSQILESLLKIPKSRFFFCSANHNAEDQEQNVIMVISAIMRVFASKVSFTVEINE